ncbi:MAG TPA: hypothetical protein DCX78_10120, partial [Nitrospina sp.]|nr:hypothetical protein [Nitrospina sp.]
GEHHEQFNGEGYPLNLSGERISLFGRLCTVMDFFSALTKSMLIKQSAANPTSAPTVIVFPKFIKTFLSQLVLLAQRGFSQFLRCAKEISLRITPIDGFQFVQFFNRSHMLL